MGKGSVKGLSMPLMVMPLVVVALILACAGLAIFHLGKAYLIDELYGPHLTGLVAEKKQDIDGWCASLKKEISVLAEQPLVRELAAKTSAQEQKAKGDVSPSGGTVLSLLRDRTSPERHMLLALLSPSGRVVAASHADLLKEDWSGAVFMKNLRQPLQGAAIAGPIVLNQLSGVVIVAPVADKGGAPEGLLVSISSLQGFSERLSVERGLYKTEEIDLVTRDGETVLTSKGIPKTKVKYTIPWAASQGVQEHGNVVYTMAELKEAPFGLIGSVVTEEFLAPLRTFLTFFAICAGLILLTLCIFCLAVIPSMVIRPLKRLAGEVRAMGDGKPLDVGSAHDCRGEMGDLKDALARLSPARLRAEAVLEEGKAPVAGMPRGDSAMISSPDSDFDRSVQGEIRTRLAAIHQAATSLQRGDSSRPEKGCDAANISDLSLQSIVLLGLSDDLRRMRQGILPIAPSSFSLEDLFKEVEKEAGRYLSHKSVSFISDIDPITSGAILHYDKDRVKGIVAALVLLVSAPFKAGAITLLSSRGDGERGGTLDLSVMAVSADSVTDVPSAGPKGEAERGLYQVAAEMARQMGGVLTCRGSETSPESCCLSLPLSPQ